MTLTGNFSPVVVMSKFRGAPGEDPVVQTTAGSEVLSGKTCVLVDDMIDTGGSMIAAAKALKERGAARVVLCATHAIFSNDAIARLRNAQISVGGSSVSAIDRVMVSDTVPFTNSNTHFVDVVSLAPLIAEAILQLDTQRGSLDSIGKHFSLGELKLEKEK